MTSPRRSDGCRGAAKRTTLGWLAASVLVVGCGASTAPSPIEVPGQAPTAKSTALEAGAAVLQGMPPVRQLNIYLDGFHFHASDIDQQMEAHHYCAMLNADFHQCVLFDGNGADAKMIGIEYVISARLFADLPEEEKAFWHSHVFEVKSGQLVLPGVPTRIEREAMEQLVHTYGKTWHVWHTDHGDRLPYGVPDLMMGFTRDGQAKPALVARRDAHLGVSTKDKRADREGIAVPEILPGADAWQSGTTIRLTVTAVPSRAGGPRPGSR